jgi:ATP-dependent DNA helicase RecG
MTPNQLDDLIHQPEGPGLEFKEARGGYNFDRLVRYAAAIANEGGGHIIFGVTDKRPRTIVGTNAFLEPERTVAELSRKTHLRILAHEVTHAHGRVLVFAVPSRPVGMPIQVDGQYWARSGDELIGMDAEQLRDILLESGPDYSAQTIPSLSIDDLRPDGIALFQKRWASSSRNSDILLKSPQQLLEDAELIDNGQITLAALILLGKRPALTRHLGQAEVIFEYRDADSSIEYSERREFREGFLPVLDELWSLINLRNPILQFQDGLFRREIPAFNESVIREAILNALAHRDYRLGGSIFIRQFPRRIEIISPGGFPPGITPETILSQQYPRNRRLAEACARCGLVERSGQGADRMFGYTIQEGKPAPNFHGTDKYEVRLHLRGEINNPQFIQFLERVREELNLSFVPEDLIVLDRLQREEKLPPSLAHVAARLHDYGVVERIGRGRGARLILSRKFYSFMGNPGAYTRTKGLDRQTNKELLMRHILDSPEGAKFQDLQEVLKDHSRTQVQVLLRELVKDGRIHLEGNTKGARWKALSTQLLTATPHPPS